MKNILYIADPNSIHDVKWMTWFSEKPEYNCFFLFRKTHSFKANLPGIKNLGSIDDYSVFKPWKNKKSKDIINRIIEVKEIDLIHVFYAEPNILWANHFGNQIPTILTTRGSDILVGIQKFILESNLKNKKLISSYQKAFKHCHSIVSTSNSQKNYLKKYFNVNCPIEIIRTGIDLKNIQKGIEKKKIIFFPRNMQELYQHEFALDAIAQLPETVLNEYQFVFVNKDSENHSYVDTIKNRMDLMKQVNFRFIPSIKGSEYFKMLAEAELVIMTPKSDGAPVSGMETLASGTKLILPNLNYDEDLFDSAYFYQKDNLKSLNETISIALEEESKNNESDYLKRIDRNQEMSKLEVIYKNCM